MDSVTQFLLDPLQFPFMLRAIAAIIMIGIVSGVMGAYVITRGMSFLGDALAHTVLPGVAVAYLSSGGASGPVLIGGLVAGVLSAIGIGLLTRGQRLAEDTAIGVIFTGAFALGIAIISRAQNYAADLTHILIGEILAVNDDSLLLIAVIGVAVLIAILLLYKELLVVSFDPILAQTLKLPGEGLRLTLLVLLALTIVIGVQAVGIVLVSAMLVTPATTARFFTQRLHHLMLLAAVIAVFSGIVGMYIAWYGHIAPSAGIVLTLTALFLLAYVFAPGKGYLWTLLGRTAKTA
ncbi:MAG: manganese ABC transporter permease [Anaerolineaceae bacterium]|nr:manganese ABC transporter permease [Anaerolineaceae bacterium]